MTSTWPPGHITEDLPRIPAPLAALSTSAMLLGFPDRPPYDQDPHRVLFAHNMGRLMRRRMPVLCDGPGHVLTIGRRPTS